MTKLSELGGKRLPFLRWSVVRMMLGRKRLATDWQVGDGREEALAAYVVANARPGDARDAVRVIDEFCMTRSVLINVGDEKGEILDRAVRRASPRLLLELGTYCGYSALRMSQVMPAGARLCSIEFSAANAAIATTNNHHRSRSATPVSRAPGVPGWGTSTGTAGRHSSEYVSTATTPRSPPPPPPSLAA